MVCDSCRRAIDVVSIRVVRAGELWEILNGYSGIIGRVEFLAVAGVTNQVVSCVGCDPVHA